MILEPHLASLIAATDFRGINAVRDIDAQAAELLEKEQKIRMLERENERLKAVKAKPAISKPKLPEAPSDASTEPHGHLTGEAARQKYLALCGARLWVTAEQSEKRHRVQYNNPRLYAEALKYHQKQQQFCERHDWRRYL